MKRYIMLGVALLILVRCAFAGTMGESKPWHGLYVGTNADAAWGILNNHLTITNGSNPLFYEPVLAGVNASGSRTFNSLRFGGGLQVGYNQDIFSRFLVGLELSYHYINLTKRFDGFFLYSNSPTLHAYSLHSSAFAKQLGTLRPRLGYHLGNYLPYITAGGALTRLQFSQSFTDLQYEMTHKNQLNQTKWGWTVGTGVEYRPFEQVSFKLEYLYANFGQASINSHFLGTGVLTGLNANVANELHNIALQTLLLGVNFHFA